MAHPDPVSKWNGGVPAWAKLFVYLVTTVGLPTLMVGYFLARDAGWIDSPMLQATHATAQTVRRLEEHDKRLVGFIETFKLSQRIACQNAAVLPSGQPDFARRANCDNIR